mgnify:CR=1 FL=1
MLKMLDPLREINFYSVAFRMILACICGGIHWESKENINTGRPDSVHTY